MFSNFFSLSTFLSLPCLSFHEHCFALFFLSLFISSVPLSYHFWSSYPIFLYFSPSLIYLFIYLSYILSFFFILIFFLLFCWSFVLLSFSSPLLVYSFLSLRSLFLTRMVLYLLYFLSFFVCILSLFVPLSLTFLIPLSSYVSDNFLNVKISNCLFIHLGIFFSVHREYDIKILLALVSSLFTY